MRNQRVYRTPHLSPPLLPFHVAVMLCRARAGPPGWPATPHEPCHPRRPPLGVPSARGLATRVVSLSWAGSAHGQGLGTPVRAEAPSAWGRHRSWRAGGLAQPPMVAGPADRMWEPCAVLSCAVGAEAERGPGSASVQTPRSPAPQEPKCA